MVNEVVVGVAEELRTGTSGYRDVAEWSPPPPPPAPADAAALQWFADNLFRIADVDERERLAAQDSTWRRPRAASRR